MRKYELEFDHKNLFVSHKTWADISMSQNSFEASTVFTTFRDVLTRGGSVRILMPDESSIARSLDRMSDVSELFEKINTQRTEAGLEPLSA